MLYPAGKVRVDSALSLWRAAEHGDVGRLKMLLDAGHDVNALCDDKSVDARCRSVLSAAVDGNEPLAVRLLLRRGANPNLRDGDGDRYPLHWASAYGDHDECAELLVQAGAALEAYDARGHTPLEFARGADGSVHGFARLGPRCLGVPRRVTGWWPSLSAQWRGGQSAHGAATTWCGNGAHRSQRHALPAPSGRPPRRATSRR